jgi:N-acetylglucosamine-6-sulfatase
MSNLARAIFAAAALVVVIVVSAIVMGSRNIVEAARDERPNIVVVMTDDQYNTTVKDMPYTSSRTDWAQFSNAMVNTSLCCPSRSTFLTGQTSTHTGIESNSECTEFDHQSTVAEWLDDRGYQTGYVGKYMNKFPWGHAGSYVPTGWDYWAGYDGGQTYFDFTLNENGSLVNYAGPHDYSTDVLSGQAVNFIDNTNSNHPFFAFVAYNSPHAPWTPPRRYADKDVEGIRETPAFLEKNVRDKPLWIRQSETPPAKKLREDRVKHNQALLAVDDGVEDIFKALQERGELDNTIVIFTSDHGISIGEHRYNHKTCGYEVCSRVPVLVRGPGVTPGTIDGLIGNIDFAPTITDYAGIKTGKPVDGRSFRSLLERRKTTLHKAILLRRAQGQGDRIFWGLRTPRWKYVHYTRTEEKELYDLKRDPDELFNLLSTKRKRWKKKAAQLEVRINRMRKVEPQVRH